MQNLSGPLGTWNRDSLDLPCFDLEVTDSQHPYAPMRHLMASGRLSAFADRWGNLALFTTEGAAGYQDITRNAHLCRSCIPCCGSMADWSRWSPANGQRES